MRVEGVLIFVVVIGMSGVIFVAMSVFVVILIGVVFVGVAVFVVILIGVVFVGMSVFVVILIGMVIVTMAVGGVIMRFESRAFTVRQGADPGGIHQLDRHAVPGLDGFFQEGFEIMPDPEDHIGAAPACGRPTGAGYRCAVTLTP